MHRQQRWPERSHWAGGILLAVIVVLLLNVIAKILWDWLDLLSVPIVVAILGYLFNRLEYRSRWLDRVLWVGGILLAVIIVLLLILIGYEDYPLTTGFGQSEVSQGIQPAKTLWDWLDLLVVPIVLAIGGYLFTRSETQATQVAAELFAIKPFWLTSQLAEYHKDPDRLFRPVCVAVAAVILGDAGRWEEVKEEVEKELGGRG